MKKTATLLFFLFFLANAQTFFGQNIVINEILTSNTTINTDEDGDYHDWIELYNTGAITVNLSGYGLSDDPALLFKWVFPNVSVAPGQYLLIWCSDKNRRVAGSPLHTNYKISSTGEVISLTNPSGVTVNSVPATVIPQNISYGRLPNGTGGFVFFSAVTPNTVNSSVGYTSVLSPPTFSQESGFFTTGFNMTLSTTVAGSTILYTLDGSEPKASNLGGTTYSYKNQYPEHPGQATGSLLSKNFTTLQYSAPLVIADKSAQPNKIANISTTCSFTPTYIPTSPILKGTVVRAKLIKPGSLDSKTVTKTYYIYPGGNPFSLPVVSISMDENMLYDYYNGIYVAGKDFDDWRIAHPTWEPIDYEDHSNYYRRGIENERPANFTYFENGLPVLNQDIGLRVHGGSSRDFPSKSFALYARSDYGDDTMSHQFFIDRPFANFGSLVLHNSGNDFNQTMFTDALNHELVKTLNVVTKGYQPTITFINGEFNGLLNLRDKIDDNYFKRVFNIPTTEIDLLENEGAVEEGDDVHYWAMIDYMTTHSFATQANFDYIKTQLDPESFKDYFISNIFLGNRDWPGNNIVYWRKKTTSYVPNAPFGHDGRWRWLFHDTDDTYARSGGINYDTLAAATDPNGPEVPNPAWSTLMLRKLLENNTFKIEFINRFADLLNTNFLSSRVLSKIDEMKAVIAPEMPRQFARWDAPADDGDWNYFLNIEKDFASQRPALQRNHIRAKFGIASNINATLNVSNASHGYIKMNTIDVVDGTPGIVGNPYPWTGIYFHNIPVTLKAVAKPGYVFDHWSGASTSTNAEITLTPTANFSITANFIAGGPEISVPIYFWMMDGGIVNDTPLQTLNSTYKISTDGVIQYQSCMVGYPFTSASPNWRKASMERRNFPTPINYRPEANNNLAYASSDMKGLQIRQPFQSGGLQNTLIFNFSTAGYQKIKFSFAAADELAGVSGITVDYAVNSGTPVWITTGLTASSLPLTSVYQLFQVDFSSITTVNNNANFKVRLRFTGSNMTVDLGNRVTFNNIAVEGVQTTLDTIENDVVRFKVYPNPVTDILNITGNTSHMNYKIFTVDGKLVKTDWVESARINLSELQKGMYLLQLSADDKVEIKKIIKK